MKKVQKMRKVKERAYPYIQRRLENVTRPDKWSQNIMLYQICFFNAVGNFSNKNVNVTTIMFLMSGDLTGLCLYILLLKLILVSNI